MGVRRCLARSLTSLALMRTPKSANGPRSNSFRPDSPSTTNLPRGRKTQTAPLTTPDMVRSERVLLTSVKSPSKLFRYQESPYFPKIYCIRISEPDNAYKKLRHGRNMLKFRTIPQTVISYPKMNPSTP